MASHISLLVSGFLVVIITIVVQSVPIEKVNEIVQAPSINNEQTVKQQQQLLKSVVSLESSSISTSTTTSPTTTVSQSLLLTSLKNQDKNDNKKKRNINDVDNAQFDELLDSESDETDGDNSYQLPALKLDNNNHKIEHVLHAKMQETPVQIHDNADKPVDTDDSNVFSDIKMTPNQLTDIIRRRRDVKLNMESNRRRKRALSPYDFYETNSFYDPYVDLVEGNQYVRPARSFAPLYWYPSGYERNIRAALAPSFYESRQWPRLYSSNIADDESDENPLSGFDDDDEDVNDYEVNRYPILLQSSNNPFDNLQLQQRYNNDDSPIDEDTELNLNDDDDDVDEDDDDEDDDDDEEQYRSYYQQQRPYYTRYGSIDTYLD